MGANGRKRGENTGILAARRKRRREEAEARQKLYESLTADDKLVMIEDRPGESKKERARVEAEVMAIPPAL